MFTSEVRKKLQAAINAATNPAEIARLTAQLAKLLDAEGRARGRRQRARARAQKAAASAPELRDDGDEIFELDPAPALPTTQPELTTEQRRENMRILGVLPEAPVEPAPRATRPRPAPPENGLG